MPKKSPRKATYRRSQHAPTVSTQQTQTMPAIEGMNIRADYPAHRPYMQRAGVEHASMLGEPDSDQRDECLQVFGPKLEAMPTDGLGVLALLKKIQKWESDALARGEYHTSDGNAPRPYDYSCVLGACEILLRRGVIFLPNVLLYLAPYLGDALLQVHKEGWFYHEFRVLGLGEFARRLALSGAVPQRNAPKKGKLL